MMKAALKLVVFALLLGFSLTPLHSPRLLAAEITYVGIDGAASSPMDHIAIRKEIFAGLDVEFVGPSSGPQMASALIQRQ